MSNGPNVNLSGIKQYKNGNFEFRQIWVVFLQVVENVSLFEWFTRRICPF